MFDKDKQIQKASGSALAVQANRDVNIGMQYSDVKDLVTLLLERNFPKLREEAVAEARLYVGRFSEKLFEKISRLETDVASELKRPDIQAAINEGIEYSAKRTDSAELDTISELIAHKVSSGKGSLKSIVIDQSIEMLSKLDLNLIRFFAFSYYLRRVTPTEGTDEKYAIEAVYGYFLERFFPLVEIEPVDLGYLQYLGAYLSGKRYEESTSAKICRNFTFDIPVGEYQKTFLQDSVMLATFPYLCALIERFGFSTVCDFDHVPLNKVCEYIGLSYLRGTWPHLIDPYGDF
ncbi:MULTISPECIES: LPO_1073/Vpar_1526 family protein [Halomonadaceae]|uniref:LPO_1073/Vpar_1526 family protein n=1 Tax=Halomonadaceae TaxID=28256 RepID=UPI0012F06F60|nr:MULTISPECIES: LPO_1073/Vpar_1526 family protein [Halomonas]CAD5270178.1 conserved hypothetical protein [Halomonas sp. 156]CAD5280499.1 conserved hypothetical protein [Halomonas sp. 113]CAD5281966.1 conserved hypothetical protein [Halomonas sp. 59]CAD5288029.1 conserved hypothetical protein [Halomonas sp. I3]VXB12248.1 conserved hypothetical protein [Halomonas titanicae]